MLTKKQFNKLQEFPSKELEAFCTKMFGSGIKFECGYNIISGEFETMWFGESPKFSEEQIAVIVQSWIAGWISLRDKVSTICTSR